MNIVRHVYQEAVEDMAVFDADRCRSCPPDGWCCGCVDSWIEGNRT